MESPFFGRTGFLDAQRDGLPISHKPRLLTGERAGGFKWYPTLLSCPQCLLYHLSQGGEVDVSLLRYLRLSYMVELMAEKEKRDRAEKAVLMRDVLRWNARQKYPLSSSLSSSSSSPRVVRFSPPELTIVIVKDGKSVGTIAQVSHRAATLLGKDHALNDIFLDHPSCSGQHAALTVQFSLPPDVEKDMGSTLAQNSPGENASGGLLTRPGAMESFDAACTRLWRRLGELEEEQREAAGEEGGEIWSLELRLMDLGSTNGTFLNHERLIPYTAVTLLEGDVITFGTSTRSYVVMRSTQ
ncbi:unnamed protein product [Phytomonas sp. EM1]|nr:unnamed protein product [Phytomonas sp. EM1]|eukprot:CCW59557.1 unnamed protein product [Phytomonas sp. isolate EM1]